jgi:hypothetical protein
MNQNMIAITKGTTAPPIRLEPLIPASNAQRNHISRRSENDTSPSSLSIVCPNAIVAVTILIPTP